MAKTAPEPSREAPAAPKARKQSAKPTGREGDRATSTKKRDRDARAGRTASVQPLTSATDTDARPPEARRMKPTPAEAAKQKESASTATPALATAEMGSAARSSAA